MKIGQYVTVDDVKKLTPQEYEWFRKALKAMGHRVADHRGNYIMLSLVRNYATAALLLNHDGDLEWAPYNSYSRFHYEEILPLVAVGMMV